MSLNGGKPAPRSELPRWAGVDLQRPAAIRQERPMRGKTQLNLELSPKINSLPELAEAENACTRCPLYKDATQAVPGEGRRSAHVMLVGEQPGDKEDLSGKPYVGPAGRVLDRALAEAGIPRTEVFVTNAVKHFKHEMRGKRRVHKRPNAYEIKRCKIWLDLERALVKPVAITVRSPSPSCADRPCIWPTAPPPSSPSTPRSCCASRTRRTKSASTRISSPICDRRRGYCGKRWLDPAGADRPYSSSVNRPLTSASSASTTSAASRPLASTVIVVPGPAASIISPMIEVPPTTS